MDANEPLDIHQALTIPLLARRARALVVQTNMKIDTITTYSELIEILNSNEDAELHIEKNCGTNLLSFEIWSENEKLAKGTADFSVNEDGEINSEIAASLLELKNEFESATAYRSLVARTEPTKW